MDRHGALNRLGMDQAMDGRYSYAAICWILSKINIDYQSFVVLSLVSYAFGLATIYFSLLRTARQEITLNAFLGFGSFLTFGLSLDQMQFDIQSLQYAVCMFAVSAIAALASSTRKNLSILTIGATIFAFSIGFYQNILQIMAYFILASFVLQSATGHAWKPMLRQVALMTGCTVIGAIPYAIINSALKHMGLSCFQHYPAGHLAGLISLKIFQNISLRFRVFLALSGIAILPFCPILSHCSFLS